MATGSKITFTKYTATDMAAVPDEAKASLFIKQDDSASRVKVLVATENTFSEPDDLVQLADVDMINDIEEIINEYPIVLSGLDGKLDETGIQDLYLQANVNSLENNYSVVRTVNEEWNVPGGVLLGLFSRLTSLVSTTLTFTTSALTSIDTDYSVHVVPAASSPLIRSLTINEDDDEVKNFITLFLVAPKGSGNNFSFSLQSGSSSAIMHTCANETTFSLIVLIRIWDASLGKSKYCSIKFDDLKIFANAWA
jgi:hypothetical protein